MDVIVEKWRLLCEKAEPIFGAMGRFFVKIWAFLKIAWQYIVKLRKLFAAVPVAVAAVVLAIRNIAVLPDTVGIGLQVDGSFLIEVAKQLAVLGPVALTALCLLLMVASKRILTPWVVSVITLIVPVMIWMVNVFPS